MPTQTGSYDFKSSKKAHDDAEKKATNYIQTANGGIWVTPSDKKPDANGNPTADTRGVRITDQIDIYRGTKTVAKYGETVVIGVDDGTQSYMLLDYHSIKMVDKEGDTYLHISDLRDQSGQVTVFFIGDGSSKEFTLPDYVQSIAAIYINDVQTTAFSVDQNIITFNTAPSNEAEIKVKFVPISTNTKAYTFGLRYGKRIGLFSVAEGAGVIASGAASHAEGGNLRFNDPYLRMPTTEAAGDASHAEGGGTIASGMCAHAEGMAENDNYSGLLGGKKTPVKANGDASHAEGLASQTNGDGAHSEGVFTEANEYASHAQNYYTIAEKVAQTVIGTLNEADTSPSEAVHPSGKTDYGHYAFIIGNGYAYKNKGEWVICRSNALTVDWQGNVWAAGDIEDGNGNVLSDALFEDANGDLIVTRNISTVGKIDAANIPIFGTCSTAASTTTKVVTVSNSKYSPQPGGILSVRFTYDVPASAKLNVNSKGAKNIYYKNAAITKNIIRAGDTATFIYDGTNYHLISLDYGITDATVQKYVNLGMSL